jgi:hypothetical protein
MLRQEPAIVSTGTDAEEPKGPPSRGRQAQRRPQYLAAAFAIRPIKYEDIHPARHALPKMAAFIDSGQTNPGCNC